MPTLLYGATLNTGNTCASQGLQDATLTECVALRGAIDGTAPFWHNEADVGSTLALSGWPCGCFYYNGGGGAHRRGAVMRRYAGGHLPVQRIRRPGCCL